MESSEFAVQNLLQTTGQSEHRTDREKHLIGLEVTTTRGCIASTASSSRSLRVATRRGWSD